MTDKKTEDAEREAMERVVALLLSIVHVSGEVSVDTEVATVITNHRDNPTRIKLELMDGSELELIYKPRGQIAALMH